jgi:hypothetical protein
MMMMLSTTARLNATTVLPWVSNFKEAIEPPSQSRSSLTEEKRVAFSAQHAQATFMPVNVSATVRSGENREQRLIDKGVRLFANSCLWAINPEHHNPTSPAHSTMVDSNLKNAMLSMIPVNFYAHQTPNGADVKDLQFLISEVLVGLVPSEIKTDVATFIAPVKAKLDALTAELFPLVNEPPQLKRLTKEEKQQDAIRRVQEHIAPHQLTQTKEGSIEERLIAIFPKYKKAQNPLSDTVDFPQNNYQNRYDLLVDLMTGFYEQHLSNNESNTATTPLTQIKEDLLAMSHWLEENKTNNEGKGARNRHVQALQNDIQEFYTKD